MVKRKPVAGYRSMTEAFLAFDAQGLTSTEIAAELGVTVNRVSTLRSGCKKLKKLKLVALPPATLAGLGPHAARRGMQAVDLAARIVEVTLAEGLIDSVLDDLDGER